MTDFMKLIEIVGIVTSAVSGSLIAIEAKLDLFGVMFVACITAFGGGLTRDIILGIHPPFIFGNYHLCLIALAVSLAVFVITYFKRNQFQKFRLRAESVNNIFDAFGLASFTVTGASVAYAANPQVSGFTVVAIGMITGIGGGIYRDIITNTTPFVFQKHIYAIPSVLGSILYYLCRSASMAEGWSAALPVGLIVAIRMLATRYRWELPKITIEKPLEKETK